MNRRQFWKRSNFFYEELYNSKKHVVEVDINSIISNASKLSQEDSELIEGNITYTEARTTLRWMKNDKSPGPYGYTVEFFKFFFVDIGTFFVRSINNGFYDDQLSVTQRQGVIICIPKDDRPKQYIKNWRPISLLNTSYKIASPCIAGRLYYP